jgi:Mrp family chromosome partitioning ATPase
MLLNHDSEIEINRNEFGAVENTEHKQELEGIQENKQQQEALQMKPEATGTDMPDKTIIAVGGAKGGVGKSALAANLAVGLASLFGSQISAKDVERFPG